MNAQPADAPFIVSVAAPAVGRTTGGDTTGAIVIGMGMADVRAAKHFAKLGFPALQMRLIRDSQHHNDLVRRFATYDNSGVARCRHAMDCLAASHGVTRFILMGNCALANIAFNAAQADPRVVGLILTNPYVNDPLVSSVSFKVRWRLRRPGLWLRLLRGQVKRRRAGPSGDTGKEVARAPAKGKQDLVLPRDFDRHLQLLVATRNLQVLLVFSKGEAGLEYFRRFYRGTLRTLQAAGRLSFQVIDTEEHDFSARDDTAQRLNDIVFDWARAGWQSVQPGTTAR